MIKEYEKYLDNQVKIAKSKELETKVFQDSTKMWGYLARKFPNLFEDKNISDRDYAYLIDELLDHYISNGTFKVEEENNAEQTSIK